MANQQVDKGHYQHSYDHKGRFASYWHYIDEALSLKQAKYLEVGIGSSFVSDNLRKRGVKLTTVDIDPALEPDLVGSVLKLPVGDASVDVVLCFQVLEHLPFSEFPPVLNEFYRVTRRFALMSLPDRSLYLQVGITLYPVLRRGFSFTLPRLHLPPHDFDGQHYWEIGKRETPLSAVRRAIGESGFLILKDYRVPEKPLHHIFLMEKKGIRGRNTGEH